MSATAPGEELFQTAAHSLAATISGENVTATEVIPAVNDRQIRVVAEANTKSDRDDAIGTLATGYYLAVRERDEDFIDTLEVELHTTDADEHGLFTIRREWLPEDSPRADPQAWNELINRINTESVDLNEVGE